MSAGGTSEPLFGELLASIARELVTPYTVKAFPGGSWTRGDRDIGRGFAGDVFDDAFQGDFKVGCDVLCRAGLAEPLDSENTPLSPSRTFRLLVDVSQIPTFILAHKAADLPSLEEVLGAFVSIASHHGLIPTGRAPFQAPPDYRRAMDLLAQAGFAEPIGDRHQWTDEIGPAMRARYFWDPDGRAYADLEAARIDDEATEALRTMPDAVRGVLAKNPDNLLFWLAVTLAKYWKHGKWQPLVEDHDGVTLSGQIVLARRMVEKLKAPVRS